MSNSASPNCPHCGTPLPAGAPGGLCPRCLMALNLKTETVFTDDAPAAEPPLPPAALAPHFPHLEILECLGRGGMGVVYKARQKTLNRFVALKLLAPERVHDVTFADRFTREAQALAALNHPNIVTIHDFGQAGGFYFLLMEFVDGVNLRQLLRARKFTPEEALAIVPPLCDALQFAHERGIVHRDIKPENLLLDKTGRVKVADFGIAKMLGNAHGSGPTAGPAAPENATQNAIGTPGYSAPEQKTDPRRVDSRADIYSLGVVFYEMLTGELPGQRIEPPSRKVQIDVRLDQVVLRALEQTPELRFQQASEVKTSVETITATPDNRSTSGSVAAPAQPGTDLDDCCQRRKILIWGLVLAAAAGLLGEQATPATVGRLMETVGVVFLVLIGGWLWLPGDRVKFTRMAGRLLAIDGIFIATAALWCATENPFLPEPWLIAIAGACLGVIVYALRCLHRSLGTMPASAAGKTTARFVRIVQFDVPAGIVIALILRAFIIQPFNTSTDAAAPELPRGSQFMVWKLARNFAPGDLIAYHDGHWNNVGRVTGRTSEGLLVNRNGQGDALIPYKEIIGRVFSVYWRASNAGPASTPARFSPGPATPPLPERLLPRGGAWTNWNHQQEIGPCYAVAAASDTIVAAGVHGVLATRDPASGVWRLARVADHKDFRGITYAHGQFVAVCQGGGIFTSPEGQGWTPRVSTVTNNLLGLLWDGRQYLVGGDQGTLLASPDGRTWSQRPSGTQIHLTAFGYSGTRYVAVGNDGIIVSDDARTWRKPASWVEVARVPFTACTWTGSLFLACGLGLDQLPTIYTSPDGELWTLREKTITASLRAALTVNGAIYVAGDNVLEQSTDDGTTWTNIFPSANGNQLFMGLATEGQNLIAVGFNRNVWVLPLAP